MNSDRDLDEINEICKKEEIIWRSFWNGPEGTGGPIASLWNVQSWPTIYIIDHKGVIRDKNKRGPDLDEVVDRLVAEAEADGAGGAPGTP